MTFPCYVTTGQKGTTAGSYLKLGSAYNNPCCSASPVPSTCTNCPTESLSYDDKSIAMIRWDGVVDTITHLPGNQFFYGPIIPDEPQCQFARACVRLRLHASANAALTTAALPPPPPPLPPSIPRRHDGRHHDG